MVKEKKVNNLKGAFNSDEVLKDINWKLVIAIALINGFFQLGETVSSVFKYAGVLVIIVTLFMIDVDEYIYLLMSMQGAIMLTNIFHVSMLNLITIVYFVQRFLFKDNISKAKINERILIPIVLMVIYCTQYIFTKNEFADVLQPIKTFFTLNMLTDVVCRIESKDDAKKLLIKMFLYGAVGVFVLYGVAVAMNPAAIATERFTVSSRSGNNQFSIFIAILFSFMLTKFLTIKSKTLKTVVTIFLLVIFAVGATILSRTYAIMIGICIVSFIILGISDKKTRNNTIIYTTIVLIVVFLVYTFGQNLRIYNTVAETIDRFVNPRQGDISNGRYELWEKYIDVLANNARVFFFGDSVSGSGKERLAGYYMAHNMYIEIFYGYGLVGTPIAVWMYVAFYRVLSQKFKSLGFNKLKVLNFLPFLLTFIAGMSSHSLLGMGPTCEFFLGVCCIYCTDLVMPSEESPLLEENTGLTYNYNSYRRVSR